MAVTEKKEKVTEAKAPKKAAKATTTLKKEAATQAAQHADIAYKVLVEPWVTEKTHAAMADNKYTFKVTKKATKTQVKKAVEGMYKVKVEKVAVVNVLPKKKAYGRHEGTISGYKKATLTLKKGDKIEFFQGA